MKREDFKKITDKHFKICEDIIRENGRCSRVLCCMCPFNTINSINERGCLTNGYASNMNSEKIDNRVIKSAKEFLKFRNGENMKKIKLSMHVFGIKTKKIYLVSQRIDDVLIGITPDGDKIAFDENGFSLENKENKVVTSNLSGVYNEYIRGALYKCDQEESGVFIRKECCSETYYCEEYTQEYFTTESIFGVRDGYDISVVIDLLNTCDVGFKDFMELVSGL